MKNSSSHIILQVERAASDLRRGQPVILTGAGKKEFLINPGEYSPSEEAETDHNHPAVRLLKIAGLLPCAVLQDAPANSGGDFLTVSADAITGYPEALAVSLERISEARVALETAENTRIIAFRPRFGHHEHLAVVVGTPEKIDAPYVRVHSSCITGDLLGSMRCDCGSQLTKALKEVGEQKHGVILYLSQEGRGINIANKLRAYELQDKGLDTVEANEALGFLPDERDYALAVEMLRQLGLKRITLLTNNPTKIKALAERGIEVVRREPVVTEINPHNRNYLRTKAIKMGHHLKNE